VSRRLKTYLENRAKRRLGLDPNVVVSIAFMPENGWEGTCIPVIGHEPLEALAKLGSPLSMRDRGLGLGGRTSLLAGAYPTGEDADDPEDARQQPRITPRGSHRAGESR
jgi:hypothetical protein